MEEENVQIFSIFKNKRENKKKSTLFQSPLSDAFDSSLIKKSFPLTTISSDNKESKCANTSTNDSIMKSFNRLDIHDWLLNALYKMSFKEPTPIQQRCIKPILNGNNIIACAETGSGKTAAFVIPILQLLSKDPHPYFALILTPTRELAIQIAEQIQILGIPINVRLSLIIGGFDITTQTTKLLSQRPHIIVATPGRIRDILKRIKINGVGKEGTRGNINENEMEESTEEENESEGEDENKQKILNATSKSHKINNIIKTKKLSNLKFLVFDEADRMLQDDSSFIKDELPDIMNMIDSNVQMLAFSATMISQVYDYFMKHSSSSPRKLCQIDLCRENDENDESNGNDPSSSISNSSLAIYKTVQKIVQRSILIPSHVRHVYLLHLLKNSLINKSVIVFVGKCRACELTFRILKEFKLNVGTLHSKLSQKSRLSILDQFRSGRISILVCTDIASRGLDLPLVYAVINMELPADPRDYVHRIGRTGRAGRAGLAISFISERDVNILENLQMKTRVKLEAFEETPKESEIINLLNKVGIARKKIMIHMINSDKKYQRNDNEMKGKRMEIQ